MDNAPAEHPEASDAAQAFEDLRTEVAVMRRGVVEALRRVVAENKAPDYTEDLSRIAKAMEALRVMLEKNPALKLTPEQYGAALARVGPGLLHEALDKLNVAAQDISRVLVNLFNNAFYAVRQKQLGGTAGPTYQPTVWVATRSLPNGVEIRVHDNGTGIPDELEGKIFQPFFTTKPTGSGTGLGLSLSYDIITKGHGGTLAVESEEHKGTTFTIMLPG